MKLWDRLTRRDHPLEKTVASVPLSSPAELDPIAFQDITAQEAALKVSGPGLQVLDVRFEYEYQSHHIPGATLVPLPQLPQRYRELDSRRPTLVVCEHGIRSLNACEFLSAQGFKRLFNLVGGMSAYRGEMEGSSVNR